MAWMFRTGTSALVTIRDGRRSDRSLLAAGRQRLPGDLAEGVAAEIAVGRASV
jgi:hypothetical protein